MNNFIDFVFVFLISSPIIFQIFVCNWWYSIVPIVIFHLFSIKRRYPFSDATVISVFFLFSKVYTSIFLNFLCLICLGISFHSLYSSFHLQIFSVTTWYSLGHLHVHHSLSGFWKQKFIQKNLFRKLLRSISP